MVLTSLGKPENGLCVHGKKRRPRIGGVIRFMLLLSLPYIVALRRRFPYTRLSTLRVDSGPVQPSLPAFAPVSWLGRGLPLHSLARLPQTQRQAPRNAADGDRGGASKIRKWRPCMKLLQPAIAGWSNRKLEASELSTSQL
jgi:hypothetical protein